MENNIDSKALAIEIAKILDKKKAQDVRVLKVESLTVLTDYFVIASGTSRYSAWAPSIVLPKRQPPIALKPCRVPAPSWEWQPHRQA